MNNQKITLSGFAGTGKSTVGKQLAKELGYEFVSVGNFAREFAQNEYGLSINEFQDLCIQKPELDDVIDIKFKDYCSKTEKIVADYRLGFHFVKDSFNILLKVSDQKVVERLKSDNRGKEKIDIKSISKRNSEMQNRFLEKYSIDFTDEANYNLVINTDDLTLEQVVNEILSKLQAPQIPSVNFHLWEPCNMRCKFCFATFQDVKKSILPKGHLPKEEAINVVKQLAEFGFEKITFAGGEPTLCSWLSELIATAKDAGMTTMIVTNGSKLSNEFLELNRTKLDWIAVSIDSLNDQTNLLSGRAVLGKKPLQLDFYKSLVDKIRSYGYGLKINTVVSQSNFDENLNEFIEFATPQRWKILQVLPIRGQNDFKIDDFKISQQQFENFLNIHSDLKTTINIVPESNSQVKGSYVMVDPAGRFFDNSEGIHNYSKPILEIGIGEALKQVNYDFNKFINRGGKYKWNLK